MVKLHLVVAPACVLMLLGTSSIVPLHDSYGQDTHNSRTTSQIPPGIEIWTDKHTYGLNQSITIRGQVPRTNSEDIDVKQSLVILEFGNVLDGHAYLRDVAPLSQDGSFSYVVRGQDLRTTTLPQTVRALYYCYPPAEASFNFTSTYVRPELANVTWHTFPLFLDGEEHIVEYGIAGASLSSISADKDLRTITLTLRTVEDGKVVLEFRNGTNDLLGVFPEVFVDTIPGEAQLLHLREGLTVLQVEFERGTEDIELIGPFMFDGEPSLNLTPYKQYPKSFDTKSYVSVAEEDFFILLHINGADSCAYSFSQENKNFRIELMGKGSESGNLGLFLPLRLFSGNFSVFIDGAEQDNTHVQKEAALIRYNGQDNAFTYIEQRFSWSNPDILDTITIEVYASRVLPEFRSLLVGFVATASVITVIIVTRFDRRILGI